MNCSRFRFLIQQWFDATMQPQDERMLIQHLDSCDSCARFQHQLEQIVQSAPEVPLPDECLPSNIEAMAKRIKDEILSQKQPGFMNTIKKFLPFLSSGSKQSKTVKPPKSGKGQQLNREEPDDEQLSSSNFPHIKRNKPTEENIPAFRGKRAQVEEDILATSTRLKSMQRLQPISEELPAVQASGASLGTKFGVNVPQRDQQTDEQPLTFAESIRRKVKDTRGPSNSGEFPITQGSAEEPVEWATEQPFAGATAGNFGQPPQGGEPQPQPTWGGQPGGFGQPAPPAGGIAGGGMVGQWGEAASSPAPQSVNNNGWGDPPRPGVGGDADWKPKPTADWPAPGGTPAGGGAGGGWGAQTPAGGETGGGWGAQTPADSSVDGGWGAPAPAGSSVDGGWGAQTPAGSGVDGGWGAPAPTGGGVDGSWGAQTPAGSGSTGDWGAPAPAGGGSTGDWGAPAPAGGGSTGDWGAPAPAGSGSTGDWGAPAPAGGGSTGDWGAPAPAGGGSIGDWGAQTPAGSGSTGGWGAQTPAGGGSTGGWGAQTPAGGSVDGGWGAPADSGWGVPSAGKSDAWTATPEQTSGTAASSYSGAFVPAITGVNNSHLNSPGSPPMPGQSNWQQPNNIETWSEEGEQIQTGMWQAFTLDEPALGTPTKGVSGGGRPSVSLPKPGGMPQPDTVNRWDVPIQERMQTAQPGSSNDFGGNANTTAAAPSADNAANANRWDVPIQERRQAAQPGSSSFGGNTHTAAAAPAAENAVNANRWDVPIQERMQTAQPDSSSFAGNAHTAATAPAAENAANANRWDVPIQERMQAAQPAQSAQPSGIPAAAGHPPVSISTQANTTDPWALPMSEREQPPQQPAMRSTALPLPASSPSSSPPQNSIMDRLSSILGNEITAMANGSSAAPETAPRSGIESNVAAASMAGWEQAPVPVNPAPPQAAPYAVPAMPVPSQAVPPAIPDYTMGIPDYTMSNSGSPPSKPATANIYDIPIQERMPAQPSESSAFMPAAETASAQAKSGGLFKNLDDRAIDKVFSELGVNEPVKMPATGANDANAVLAGGSINQSAQNPHSPAKTFVPPMPPLPANISAAGPVPTPVPPLVSPPAVAEGATPRISPIPPRAVPLPSASSPNPPVPSPSIPIPPVPNPQMPIPAPASAPAANASDNNGLFKKLDDKAIDQIFSNNLGLKDTNAPVSSQPSSGAIPAPPVPPYSVPGRTQAQAPAAPVPPTSQIPPMPPLPANISAARPGLPGPALSSPPVPPLPGSMGMNVINSQPANEPQGWSSPAQPSVVQPPAAAAGKAANSGLLNVDDVTMDRIFSDLGVKEKPAPEVPKINVREAVQQIRTLADTPAPPKVEGIGRLSRSEEVRAEKSPGKINAIGKFLLDQQDLQRIGKLTQEDLSDTKVRVLTHEASDEINKLLEHIATQPGVIGSVIVGHDGILIANSLPKELDAESIGILSLAIYVNTTNIIKKPPMKHNHLHQLVSKTPHGYVVVADFGGGILVTVSNRQETEKLIPLMRSITQLVAQT